MFFCLPNGRAKRRSILRPSCLLRLFSFFESRYRSPLISCWPDPALRVTATCLRKDCRLLADSEQSENAQPHRGLVVRRCRPLDRYNNPVESTAFERFVTVGSGAGNVAVRNALIIIIRLNIGVITRVVIVRVIVERVIRIIIPREKSVIESETKNRLQKTKKRWFVEVGMPSIPIVMPI